MPTLTQSFEIMGSLDGVVVTTMSAPSTTSLALFTRIIFVTLPYIGFISATLASLIFPIFPYTLNSNSTAASGGHNIGPLVEAGML